MGEPNIQVQGKLETEAASKSAKSLLLVTPFSPLQQHGHAADDLGIRMVEGLSSQFALTIYAPGQDPDLCQSNNTEAITFAPGTASRSSLFRHFGFYPAGLRSNWSRLNSREVRRLVKKMDPDLIHIEYLQGAESVLNLRDKPWSITLHDITSRVFAQRAEVSSGIERVYRVAEHLRARFLERKVARAARRVFTLSARDATWVRSVAPRQNVSHIHIGIDSPSELWSPGATNHPVFVFAGAMWRESNIAAAEWLATEVMPIVWQRCPDAVLRIVGDRPADRVHRLSKEPGIQVVGRVDHIENEYISATAVLAPTLVDAGVLLKALRGLACGAPLIVNTAAAEPLEVRDGVHCFVRDTPNAFALKMVEVWADPDAAGIIAANGSEFVHESFSWQQYAHNLIEGIDQ